ncbi:MAG: V4R domain-containing protein [Gemmatimonadaceae bacterium]
MLDLTTNQLAALPRASLGALRAALLRDAGPAAAAYLQEAGYAGGGAMFESFQGWLAATGGGVAAELDLRTFEARATEFFREAGWGSLQVGSLREAVATLDSEDWAEADPASPLDHPGCHLTTGMFADFFGRVGGEPLAVLEVECRSMGDPRCRFLIGSAEVMGHVYDELGRGIGYEQAVAGME